MAGLYAFVQELLTTGRVVLRQRPVAPTARDRTETARFLAGVYADLRLEVAGPLLDFDEAAALTAAERVWWASWFLVNRSEPESEVEQALSLPPPPRSAAQHLSADLTLRFLAGLHGRARALVPDDVLTRRLEEYLRGWPLSGVLADLGEPPSTNPEFDHPGLQLLYAERLAHRLRPTWVPAPRATGNCPSTRDRVDLVLHERGLLLEEEDPSGLSPAPTARKNP
jgi:hypothetical protein